MTQFESTGLTVEQVQEMVRRELSTPKRFVYLLLLLITLTAAGLVGSLWLTEPAPLPLRTHVVFGLLVAINVAWSLLFAWVLTRRKVLYAVHSVIAGWMAVVFCGLFLLLGLTVAVVRMNVMTLIVVGLVGTAQLLLAVSILIRARRRRRDLLARRNELASELESNH